MRSAAVRALGQAASALQQQQAGSAGRAMVACSTGLQHLPFSTDSEAKQKQQKQGLTLPSVQALLGPRPRSSLQTTALRAHMAGGGNFDGPSYVQPGTNPWTSLRERYGFERKNSLSVTMYLNILVFGFAATLVDVQDLPPRLVALMGLLGIIMYVRKE